MEATFAREAPGFWMGLSNRPETFEHEKSTDGALVNLLLDSLALVAGQQNPFSIAW